MGARFSVKMMSTISNKVLMRFMTIYGRLNVDKFIGLLERLINNAENSRYLIVDEHQSHKASKVNKSVDSTN